MGYLDTPKPRLFAHRGASGEVPENTLEAFAAGIDAGATMLELDVHASRDGEVVVIHDETLERTTDGSGLVRSHTLAELRGLDAGHRFKAAAGGYSYRGKGLRIPTLDEVLERFATTPLNVEIKQVEPPIEEAVLTILDRHRARERVLLATEDQRIMERIRGAAEGMLTGFSAIEVAEFMMVSAGEVGGYSPRGVALQVPPTYAGTDIVTERFVETAHEIGLEVHVWTINEEAEMQRLLDLGIDGLMTDFPALGAEVLRRRRG